jgi:alkanesulfonate monooxygenase SsuD/methylene tetrahydromethanopterin reductase-like flavin-dependent oxidoreductase (luciferase family)
MHIGCLSYLTKRRGRPGCGRDACRGARIRILLGCPHPPILLGSINNRRAFKRVAEWGDGWIPAVQTVEEFSAGVKEISALAKAAGRDPATIDFTVFTTPGQWRTLKDVAALEQAGAGRVTLWLEETKLDGVLRELEELARNLELKSVS